MAYPGAHLNRRLPRLSLAAVASLLVGCGTELSDDLRSSSQAIGANNGTALSVAVSATAVNCTSSSGADVVFSGVLTTTGSVDSTLITASVDGGARQLLHTIQPQDFVHQQGGDKTAAYSVTLPLTNGSYNVELCFTQSGSQGREPKEVCAPVEAIAVACATSCSAMEPFGNLVGNPSLCKGKGPPHVPVHVRGDFGENATVTISGPNGFTHQGAMNHAGDSCNYHYNWANASNGGAGTYTFTVDGDGNQLVFTADLHCAP